MQMTRDEWKELLWLEVVVEQAKPSASTTIYHHSPMCWPIPTFQMIYSLNSHLFTQFLFDILKIYQIITSRPTHLSSSILAFVCSVSSTNWFNLSTNSLLSASNWSTSMTLSALNLTKLIKAERCLLNLFGSGLVRSWRVKSVTIEAFIMTLLR